MQIKGLSVNADLTRYCTRAKYIPCQDGSLRLVMVQSFSVPTFRPSGWEDQKKKGAFLLEDDPDEIVADDTPAGSFADVERASRRAKINAFDIIMSNPDLDTFCTFTYRPDEDLDKSSYDECYDMLKIWLSNRVQRKGLKYVVVPERHKSGDIHFHGIMNSSALNMEKAYNPSGRPIRRHGHEIYNVLDWKAGFSTAELIQCSDCDREAVAKYIFKYMGKQVGAKIGGRYCLIGGQNLARPVYVYGDTAEEFLQGSEVKYDRTVDVNGDLQYREYSFI